MSTTIYCNRALLLARGGHNQNTITIYRIPANHMDKLSCG